jgi:hypothetical protein
MGPAAFGMPSSATLRLQEKLSLVKRADTELKILAHRIANDRTLGPASPRAEIAGRELATLDFVVSETKKSGVYGALQQAAIDRLKESGNYEDLIKQILDTEAAVGNHHDRAWAEDWIKRKFDYDCVDADHQPGELYIDVDAYHGSVRPSAANEGGATFFGNKTDVHARGSFTIKFTGTADQLFYVVENTFTGENSPPRPYDPRGTAIEAKGLRADMVGIPAPGDEFYVSKSSDDRERHSEYRVGYIDPYVRVLPKHQKIEVFNRLFAPMMRGDDPPKLPSEMIRDIIFHRA